MFYKISDKAALLLSFKINEVLDLLSYHVFYTLEWGTHVFNPFGTQKKCNFNSKYFLEKMLAKF